MAYEQHIHQHTHKQHNNHRRNFWPMYSGPGSYGSGHPNNQNNHQASAEHFLQSSQASTFLQELIDCNRKRGPMVTGSGNHLRNPPLPHPPPPQSGNPNTQQQTNSGTPVGANGQQPPMSDANANLNNEHWNFMGPKMGQWGDKNGVAGSAAPVGGPNGNQQLEDDFRLEYMVEYMELDEFLTENDIPLESVLHDQPQNLDDDPKQSRNNSVSKPMGPPSMVPSPASNSVGTDSNSGSSQIKTECVNNQQPPGHLGGLDGSRLDRSPYDQSPSPQQQTNGQDFSNLTQLQSATQPGPLCDKGGHVISLPPPAPLGPPGPPRSPLDQESESGEHGMSNAALLRKRKKQMVMDERKDEKYWERRRKNNMAAKRSRDARRAKETQIAIQATILERENKNLTTELSKARAENLLLRERLQKYEPV